MQFFECGQYQAGSGHPDGVSQRDSASVDIQDFVRDIAERRFAPQMFPAIDLRFCRFLARDHLRSERFVDFDDLGVFQA
jgi:hypothetical protein